MDERLEHDPYGEVSAATARCISSSKPAAIDRAARREYWAIKTTGWTLPDNPYEVGRLMLFTVQVLPRCCWMLASSRVCRSGLGRGLGRIFVVAAAAFRMMLTPFVVLNNDTIAARERGGRAVCLRANLVR